MRQVLDNINEFRIIYMIGIKWKNVKINVFLSQKDYSITHTAQNNRAHIIVIKMSL